MADTGKNDSLHRLDLGLRAFLGVIGVAVTLMLGWGQYRLGRDQSRQEAEFQALSIVKDYLHDINAPGDSGERAMAVVTATAEHLSVVHKNTLLANVADRLVKLKNFRVAEATAPPARRADWFAVLASYGENQKRLATEDAARLRGQIGNEYQVDIYKTLISRNLAITVGGRLPKTEAQLLAATAREKAWSPTAFAQVDRQWSHVSTVQR